MDDQKPELDEYGHRNLEEYADRLWQQRVKTERESADSDEETGGYSPTREYYDTYYTGETDSFREPFEYPLKRSADDLFSSTSAGGATNQATPTKRGRGRPYKEACVKLTCLRPEDRLSTTLTVDFNKLQEEGLGVPKSELVGGLRSSSKLPLTWSSEEMRNHVLRLYPRVRNFQYMKCTPRKTLEPLPDDIKPADLRNLLGRSGLYIVPLGTLLPKVQGATPEVTASHVETSRPLPVASPPGSSASSSGSATTAAEASSTAGKQYWNPTRVSGEKVTDEEGEFRITLDISSYSPDEITLKTKNSRIVVHARHGERADEYGLVEREFKRQYNLPKEVDPNEVTSSLSSSGILTLKAPKMTKDNGKERIIPIHFSSDDS